MSTIAQHLAEQFPDALQRMEQSRDISEVTGFFAEDAVLSNLGAEHDRRGPDGVRHFWETYLERFAEIRTQFLHHHLSGQAVILEWCSEGRHAGGQPLSYCGVSILVFDPQGKISGFRAYYDSAAFVGPPASGRGST